MSLWGNSDNLDAAALGYPTSLEVVGTASSEFWTAVGAAASTIKTGTTMIFSDLGGVPGDLGMAVMEAPLYDAAGVMLDNVVKINILSSVPTQGAPVPVLYSEQPIQICHDPGFNGWSNPSGVTTSGAAVAGNPSFAEIGRTQMAAGVGTDTMNALQKPGDQPAINFHLDHSGWVGVMTYMSTDGETGITTMRVKKEVYVAMSGIETGNRPYPDTFGVTV